MSTQMTLFNGYEKGLSFFSIVTNSYFSSALDHKWAKLMIYHHCMKMKCILQLLFLLAVNKCFARENNSNNSISF